MNSLRAKLQVYQNKPSSVVATGEKQGEYVLLSAVYSSDPDSENYSYSKATPAATLNMTITNPDAFDFFEEGKQYVVTFEKAQP